MTVYHLLSSRWPESRLHWQFFMLRLESVPSRRIWLALLRRTQRANTARVKPPLTCPRHTTSQDTQRYSVLDVEAKIELQTRPIWEKESGWLSLRNTFTAMHQTWASVLCSSYFRGAKSRAENQLTSSKNALTDAAELHGSLYTKILQLRAIPIFFSFCLCEDLTSFYAFLT